MSKQSNRTKKQPPSATSLVALPHAEKSLVIVVERFRKLQPFSFKRGTNSLAEEEWIGKV